MAMLEPSKLQPGLSIDCVIFGFHDNELKVLLLKMKHMDKWALPGGFVEKDQDVDDEAIRVLKQRTGLENIFLQQFHLFGQANRSQPDHAELLVNKNVIPPALKAWFEQRFVTIGYYALVEYSQVQDPKPDLTSDFCEWCSLSELPPLMLDHKEIIDKAHYTLKKELNYQPIGLNLLAEEFTMPELQTLYEIILEKQLDRRNFRRKMLSYDILIDTKKHRMGGAHKAPLLYKFDKEKYKKAISGGLKQNW